MGVPDTDLAWLAGFLDGEGTIGFASTGSKNFPHMYIRPHLQASNTDRRMLDRAADILEAITGKRSSFVVTNKKKENWRKAWRIAAHTQWELMLILPQLLPFLVGKQRQAELVLAFCKRKHGRATRHWYEHADLDQAAYWECRALNHRGNKPLSPVAPHLALVKEA